MQPNASSSDHRSGYSVRAYKSSTLACCYPCLRDAATLTQLYVLTLLSDFGSVCQLFTLTKFGRYRVLDSLARAGCSLTHHIALRPTYLSSIMSLRLLLAYTVRQRGRWLFV